MVDRLLTGLFFLRSSIRAQMSCRAWFSTGSTQSANSVSLLNENIEL